ncbi:MAG: ABC transporter permease subunit [Candidatus Micrarchaeota archaeon]
MQTKYFAILFILFLAVSAVVIGTDTIDLIYYAFRSFLRMISAYGISIIFSFIFGILIIHNKKIYEYIFPMLDILQAIPILGFFPFAILFFMNIFPGGILGQEFSSIFLIFTSMTWAIIFAVIESGTSIINEIRDLAKILNLNGMKYLTQIVFPITFPQFISGSIAGWGGGWYFLVAAEYLSLGNTRIDLPGIGAYIAKSAFSFNFVHSFFGIAMLAFVVSGMNIYVWQPLLSKARIFSFKPIIDEDSRRKEDGFLVKVLQYIYGKIKYLLEKVHKPTEGLFTFLSVTPSHSSSNEKINNTISYFLIGSITVVLLYFLFFNPPLLQGFSFIPFVLYSTLRILIAFIISLVWTSAIAIFLARNKSVMSFLMPLFDLGQSIPAVAIFPIIVVFVIQVISKILNFEISLEIASILVVITGMQWYFLFNLIRAVQTIPDEILELSTLFNLKTLERFRHIMIPAIMPAVFVGSLEAIGGGWNASIISEYIMSPESTPYPMKGIGFLLSTSSANGDINGVIISVCAITLLVLIPHQFVWKKLIRESYKYKF